MESDGTFSGNSFTSDSLGAVDGISYTGKAEPVDFDTLCTTAGVPAKFSQLELTFVAEGETVEVMPFQYGSGVETLPKIPAKKGYSAAWPDMDYSCLTASQTVEAVYTPYSSALTDDGNLPQILVDGSFGARATVNHTSEEVSWTDEKGNAYNGNFHPHCNALFRVCLLLIRRLRSIRKRKTQDDMKKQWQKTDGCRQAAPRESHPGPC